MPTRDYMVVDPRHDHSMRIPRPDLSVAIGTPNACNNCHEAAARGFIVIRKNPQNPYMQSFRPVP